MNRAGVVSEVGDDGIVVVQGKTTTGLYYYLEKGGAGAQGSELTLLGIFDAHLQQNDVIFGA
jgi:hypothetical protein